MLKLDNDVGLEWSVAINTDDLMVADSQAWTRGTVGILKSDSNLDLLVNGFDFSFAVGAFVLGRNLCANG